MDPREKSIIGMFGLTICDDDECGGAIDINGLCLECGRRCVDDDERELVDDWPDTLMHTNA